MIRAPGCWDDRPVPPQTITCRQAINRCAQLRRTRGAGRGIREPTECTRQRRTRGAGRVHPWFCIVTAAKVLPDDGGAAFGMDLL